MNYNELQYIVKLFHVNAVIQVDEKQKAS